MGIEPSALRSLAAEIRAVCSFDGGTFRCQIAKLKRWAARLDALAEQAEAAAPSRTTPAETELAAIKKLAKCLRLEDLIGGDDLARRSETIAALKTMEVVAALQIENLKLSRSTPAPPVDRLIKAVRAYLAVDYENEFDDSTAASGALHELIEAPAEIESAGSEGDVHAPPPPICADDAHSFGPCKTCGMPYLASRLEPPTTADIAWAVRVIHEQYHQGPFSLCAMPSCAVLAAASPPVAAEAREPQARLTADDLREADAALEHVLREPKWGAINVPMEGTYDGLFVRFTRGDLQRIQKRLRNAAPETAVDEEMTSHTFVPINGDWVNNIWCKDCAYHRDHSVHAVAPAAPRDAEKERP